MKQEQYRFEIMPGGTVIWVSESGSGVAVVGSHEWDAYQAWVADGNTPTSTLPPVPITQAMAMALVEQEFDRACEPIRGTSPQAEIDSWPMQVAEARAFMADASAPTPLIDGVLLPWEDKQEFCTSVISNSEAYAIAMGEILMWRRIAIAAVEAMFEDGPRHEFYIQYPEVPSAS